MNKLTSRTHPNNGSQSQNPFVRHQERLVDLLVLTRCSLQYTVADLALALTFPDSQDVDLNKMLQAASDDDLDIACALIRWKKNTIPMIHKVKLWVSCCLRRCIRNHCR